MGFSSSRFETGKSMDDKKETTGSNSPKIEDLVHLHKFPDDGKWHLHRLVGGIQSYCFWWLPLKTKAGKVVNIPKQSLAWDEVAEADDTSKEDPYRAAAEKMAPMFPDDGKQRHRNAPKFTPHFYINSIPRETQDDYNPDKNRMNDGEKESGYKDINNDRSRTPVEVLRLPPTAAAKVASLKQLNTHVVDGETRAFSVSHPKYGCDVAIQYDSEKQGASQYDFNLRNHTPLRDEEYEYLIWKLDQLLEPEDLDTAKREARKIVDTHSGGSGFSRANNSDDFEGSGDKGSGDKGRSRRSELDDFDAPPARGGRASPDRDSSNNGGRVARDEGERSSAARRPAPEDDNGGTPRREEPRRDADREEERSERTTRRIDPADDPSTGSSASSREEPRREEPRREETKRSEEPRREETKRSEGTSKPRRDNFDL